MAEQTYSADWNAEVPRFGMQALWRSAIWGGLATFALFTAVISAYSNAGSQRQATSISSGQGNAGQAALSQAASGQASSGQATAGQGTAGQGTVQRTLDGEVDARPGETAEDARRLAEAVHALAADRDQALARIAALERNLDGVTGSIKRDRTASAQPAPLQAAPLQAAPLQAAPVQAAPQNPVAATSAAPVARPEPPAAPVIEAAVTPARAPAPQPSSTSDAGPTAAPDAGNRVAATSPSNPVRVTAPAEPIAAAPQAPAGGLGVDVGGAIDYSGLRALWRSTKNTDPALLEELYPVVTVRENGKTHNAELRLVIGPIADAEAAERLCTTLAAAHHYCQPVAFEGQRLAVSDTAPPKAAPAPSHRSGANHSEASPSESGSFAFKTVPESPSHVRAIIGK
jgi:hypothetical protein